MARFLRFLHILSLFLSSLLSSLPLSSSRQLLSAIHTDRSDPHTAIEWRTAALLCYPASTDMSDDWMDLAEWAMSLGMREHAQLFLYQYSRWHKQDVTVTLMRAQLYKEMGQDNAATVLLAEYLRNNPMEMALSRQYAAQLVASGKEREAIILLTRGVTAQIRCGIRPDGGAILQLASLYSESGQHTEVVLCIDLIQSVTECHGWKEAPNPVLSNIAFPHLAPSLAPPPSSLSLDPTVSPSSSPSPSPSPSPTSPLSSSPTPSLSSSSAPSLSSTPSLSSSSVDSVNMEVSPESTIEMHHTLEERSDAPQIGEAGWVGSRSPHEFRDICNTFSLFDSFCVSQSELCVHLFGDVACPLLASSSASDPPSNPFLFSALPSQALILKGKSLVRLDRWMEAERDVFHPIIHSEVHENAKQIFAVSEEYRMAASRCIPSPDSRMEYLLRARRILTYLLSHKEVWPGLLVSFGAISKDLWLLTHKESHRDDAIGCLERVLLCFGSQSEATLHLSEIYEREGRFVPALDLLQMHLRCLDSKAPSPAPRPLWTPDALADASAVEFPAGDYESVFGSDFGENARSRRTMVSSLWIKIARRVSRPRMSQEAYLRTRISILVLLDRLGQRDELASHLIEILSADPFIGESWERRWSWLADAYMGRKSHTLGVPTEKIWKVCRCCEK